MPNHLIMIKNCNNIRNAEIALSESTLNIKFGYNGTGKSTISEAIRLKIEGGELNDLTPYSDTDSEDDNVPTVGEIPFQTVKVFNEECHVRSFQSIRVSLFVH